MADRREPKLGTVVQKALASGPVPRDALLQAVQQAGLRRIDFGLLWETCVTHGIADLDGELWVPRGRAAPVAEGPPRQEPPGRTSSRDMRQRSCGVRRRRPIFPPSSRSHLSGRPLRLGRGGRGSGPSTARRIEDRDEPPDAERRALVRGQRGGCGGPPCADAVRGPGRARRGRGKSGHSDRQGARHRGRGGLGLRQRRHPLAASGNSYGAGGHPAAGPVVAADGPEQATGRAGPRRPRLRRGRRAGRCVTGAGPRLDRTRKTAC